MSAWNDTEAPSGLVIRDWDREPRVRSVETIVVGADFRNWIFVKITTDEPGLVGWGEATLEYKTRAVVGAVEDIAPLLIGQDATRIEFLWQAMFRQQFFKGGIVTMSAISGIDQALHDIKGKLLGVPVYQLLGGAVRDRIRLYDHLGGGVADSVYGRQSAESIAEHARTSVGAGFTALKLLPVPVDGQLASNTGVREAESRMQAARDGAGPDVELIIDLHGRTTPASALRYLEALRQWRPWFVEEPCAPENVTGLARVRAEGGVPVAAGERLCTRHDFVRLADAGACDIVQPDVCHCGGISEIRRIAAVAEIDQLSLAPHNPLGPIATAVNLHVAASTSNFLIQEVMRADVPWRDEVAPLPSTISDGHASLPIGIGLGVDVDEVAARRHPYVVERQIAALDADGAVADW